MEFEDARDEEQLDMQIMQSIRKSNARLSYMPFRGTIDQTMMRRLTVEGRVASEENENYNNNNNLIESVISINHDDPYAQSQRQRESTKIMKPISQQLLGGDIRKSANIVAPKKNQVEVNNLPQE